MQKQTIARVFNIAETTLIALMLLNAYGFGYQLKVPFYFLILPIFLFAGNTWALFKTQNTVLFFVQIIGLLLLLTGGMTHAIAVLCLLPLIFIPKFFPKKILKSLAVVITVMATTLAMVSVYTLFTAPEPEVVIEQSYEQHNARLELRRQTVTAEVGPNTLRGVYFEKELLGCTFTRLLYVCADDREITLSWQDCSTALINGTPCSVYFSRLTSE